MNVPSQFRAFLGARASVSVADWDGKNQIGSANNSGGSFLIENERRGNRLDLQTSRRKRAPSGPGWNQVLWPDKLIRKEQTIPFGLRMMKSGGNLIDFGLGTTRIKRRSISSGDL